MHHAILEAVNLLFAGILAGEEFVICYVVRQSFAALDDAAHIKLRQALILRLRVLVPAIFAPTILSGVVLSLVDHFDFQYAGVVALLVFISVTLFGTVPINEGALLWNPEGPPDNWKALVARWEKLDVVRCWAAVIAFACFLIAIALP